MTRSPGEREKEKANLTSRVGIGQQHADRSLNLSFSKNSYSPKTFRHCIQERDESEE